MRDDLPAHSAQQCVFIASRRAHALVRSAMFVAIGSAIAIAVVAVGSGEESTGAIFFRKFSSAFTSAHRSLWAMGLVLWLLSFVGWAKDVTYFYTDQQGTVLATTDASGNILSAVDRKPFGQNVLGLPSNGPGFTGHVEDPDTALIYMQQRYYDPSVGRFASVDPKALDASSVSNFNRYRYGGNNPFLYTDPDGRQDCRSCEMSYGAAVGYMLRNDPARTQTWESGERAATTEGSGALDGAEVGRGVGQFVDTGNYSKPAVASAIMSIIAVAVTHGKSSGAMHGPSPKIHEGQQGKHQLGRNNYQPGRSILTANPAELGRHAGTGQQIGNTMVGEAGSKERVDFGQPIGTYVDQFGNASDTTNGIIHYGSNGMHVVPARPNDD